MSTTEQDGQFKDTSTVVSQGNSFFAALASTMTRGAALYFSRPIRLFRPSKVSGWMFLQGIASRNNVSLSPRFISDLVKQRGFGVLPRHFIPPLAINALLGTVLWSSYSFTANALEQHSTHSFLNAAISGAVAGGAQAIAAAPAENVRLVLEGNSAHSGWSSAWKDVFVGSSANTSPSTSKTQHLHEVRDVRRWMKEVGDVAGRGWHGWGWGFAKDVCGFAVFFSIFESTRRTAVALKKTSSEFLKRRGSSSSLESHTPRIIHGTTLVSGGVVAGLAYEVVQRPFDVARRTVRQYTVMHRTSRPLDLRTRIRFLVRALIEKADRDGISSFVRKPFDGTARSHGASTVRRRRIYSSLRVLGRVGPWGIGFLIWESFVPELSP